MTRHVDGQDDRPGNTTIAFDPRQLLVPFFLVALAAAAYLGWRLRVELIVLFGAGLFGIALYKLSRWLTRRSGLPHGVSVTIWFLAGVFLAVGFGIFAGRQLSDQYGQLEREIPAALETLENRLEGTPILGSLSPQIQRVRERMMADGRPDPGQSDSDLVLAGAELVGVGAGGRGGRFSASSGRGRHGPQTDPERTIGV